MRRPGGMWLVALLGSLLLTKAGAGAQSPTSIAVSPANPIMHVGQTLQFAAQSDVTLNLGQGGALAAGEDHTCALLADGTVRCWGNNGYGQLGDQTMASHVDPRPVAGLRGVKAITGGAYHTCALAGDGTVKCWGGNNYGQLGNGTTMDAYTPVVVSGLSGVRAIAAGSYHTCALLSDSTMKCWGRNSTGQLGNGTTSATPVTTAVTVREGGGSTLSGATALAAGDSHTCALLSGGTVKCWGRNFLSQLGNGTTTDSPTPVGVSGLSGDTPEERATAIFSSQSSLHTCALLSDGTAECWGYNLYGQLGDGTTNNSSTPVAVSGLNGATAIATGYYHSCALLPDSTVKCWGSNYDGELGNGTTSRETLPVNVLESSGSILSGATGIAAGTYHTCALLSDGAAQCWGENTWGKLGDGTMTGRTTPVAVVGAVVPGAGATDIAVGDYHICALLSDGTAKCWGQGYYEQLGNVSRDLKSPFPTAVYNLTGATAIAAGTYHTCALMADGTAECWGTSNRGELGTGYFGDHVAAPSPFLNVVGLTEATAIAARGENSCALVSDGTVKCWGANAYGQLGLGYHPILRMATAETVLGPGEVGYLSGARAIAVGNLHACALLADGAAMCWGRNNYGQLGDGTTNDAYSPVAVSGLSGAIAIAAGDSHTCALLFDGTVKCWGLNDHGQLGNGATSTTPQTAPITVAGLTGVIAIAAGGYHTAALLADGTAWGWGENLHEQALGSFSDDPKSPARVEIVGPLTTMAAIAAGPENTCGLLQDGTAMCWGFNIYGESGNGTSGSSVWPTAVNPLVSSVAWTSNITGVATIDAASGFAKAVALGSATITANYGALIAQTTLIVAPLATSTGPGPAITSANAAAFTVGEAGSFTVTATGTPTPALAYSGRLPAGVTFIDTGNGTATLAGTPRPNAGGTYSLTFTARNGVGSNATQIFTLTVYQAPSFPRRTRATFTEGNPGSFTVKAAGYPAPALRQSGDALPNGVTFTDNGDGTATVAGTPAAGTAGTYSLTFLARNHVRPDAIADFTLTVRSAHGPKK